MSNLLKKIFEKISYIKRYLLIQLNVNFGYPYHYFGKKITASKETYLEIYASSKNKTFPIIDEFEKKYEFKIDKSWLNDLALHTQVTIKKSKINYQHGRILYSCLAKYLKENDNVNILETGTSKGFSALCMSKALKDLNKNGTILTIDILPHDFKMFWNSIDDHEGQKTRKELLSKWDSYLNNINFLTGKSEKILKKLQIERVNFCFLDAVHKLKDLKFEFEFVSKRQSAGDLIIFDDVTEQTFNEVVEFVKNLERKKNYKITYLNSSEERGYAIAEKL
tara:strand:- start:1 stop:837 length:837 start_codon:yes stop_codon:yes gene_type:complete